MRKDIVVVAVLAAAAAVGCSDASGPPADGLSSFAFPLDSLVTVPGGVVRVFAEGRDTSGAPTAVDPVFHSTNSAVLDVEADGRFTMVTAGLAGVVATLGHRADTLWVQAATVSFTRVRQSGGRACALTASDDLYCWGSVPLRLAGEYSGIHSTTPIRVERIPGLTRFTQGAAHFCGVNPTALCWGENSMGALGRGFQDALVHGPQPPAGAVPFTTVEAGSYFTCGLNAAGAAYCWGYNSNGEIGDSTRGNIRSSPVAVIGGRTFATLTLGSRHACGLGADSVAWCWGSFAGHGTSQCEQTLGNPVCYRPLVADSLRKFVQIDAREDVTCGLTASGDVWCWGGGDPQQRGAGHQYVQIAVGREHVCGLDGAGLAWCWGVNANGQLGNGLIDGGSAAPVAVIGGHVFEGLWAGHYTTCGRAGGRVYCWGMNDSGESGDGTGVFGNQHTAPTLVAGQNP